MPPEVGQEPCPAGAAVQATEVKAEPKASVRRLQLSQQGLLSLRVWAVGG